MAIPHGTETRDDAWNKYGNEDNEHVLSSDENHTALINTTACSTGESTSLNTKAPVFWLTTVMILKTYCDALKVQTSEELKSLNKKHLNSEKKVNAIGSIVREKLNIMGKSKDKIVKYLKDVLQRTDYITRSEEICAYPILGLNEYYQELQNNPDMTTDERMKYDIIRCSTFSTYPNSDVSAMSLSRAGFYYEGNGDEVKCFQCGVKWKNWRRNANPRKIHKDNSGNCSHINDVLQSNQRTSAPVQDTGSLDVDQQADERNATSSAHARESRTSLNGNNDGISIMPNTLADPPQRSTPVTNEMPTQSRNSDAIITSTANTGRTVTKTVVTNGSSASASTLSRPTANTPLSTTAAQTLEPLGISVERPKYPQYAVMAVRLSSFRNWPRHKSQNVETLAKAGFVYEGAFQNVR